MRNITATQLYTQLSGKLGDETAEGVITYIDNKIDDKMESKLSHLATTQDLNLKVSQLKADLIQWMFAFWVSQMAATIGIMLAFMKK